VALNSDQHGSVAPKYSDMRDYGMMDGQKVLNHVLEMMK